MATTEELERQLALMRQIAEQKTKISELQDHEKTQVARISQLFLAQQNNLSKIVRQREEQAAKYAAQGDEETSRRMRRHADIARFVIRKLQDNGTEYKKYAQIAKKADNDVKKNADANIQSIAKNASSVFARSGALGGLGMTLFEGGKPGSFNKNIRLAAAKGALEFQGSFGGVGTVIMGGIGKVIGGAGNLFLDQLKRNARDIKNNVVSVIKELDTEYKKYRETVGIDLGTGAYQAFLSAMDVGTSMAKSFNADPSNKMRFFGDVHVDTGDASAALTALTNQVSGFSKLMKGPAMAFGAQLVNQAAAFSRLGIKAADTAKIFEIGSKAQKMSTQRMAKLSRQVVSVGHALDKNLNETVQDFTKMAPDLVQFGDEMTGVFARLEAQSKATGIAAGTLLDTAMRFDTFEGAAKAAGRLNAVLGQTAVDTMALIHANPDEKIDMMRKAVTRTLGPFNQLDRRTQSVIAGVMGLKGGVLEAQKLFQADSAYDEYADKITKGKDAQVLSAEELTGLMEGTANVTRILKTAASSASNVLNTATFAMQKTAKLAYAAADALGGVLSFLPTVIKDAGSVDVTPHIDAAKVKKDTAVFGAEVKKREKMQGAPGVTKPGGKPAEPKAPPAPARRVVGTSAKKMAASAKELHKALKPIPKAIDRIADSLEDMTSGKSGRALKLLSQAMPTDLTALQIKHTLGDQGPQNELLDKMSQLMRNFPSIESALSMAKDQDVKFDAKKYFETKAAYQESAEKLMSEEIGMPIAQVVKMMGPDMSTKYREVVNEKKSLDTTNYLENYTTIVKEQNISTKELAEKMDTLIEVLGGKDKTDVPVKLVGPVNLSIAGSRPMVAIVEDALARLKGL